MKTKLPPGPIRPPGNYYLLDCVPLETSYRRAFEQTLVRKTWFRRFTRGSENLCRLSSGGSGCSDYELTQLYPNLTADNPRLMEVTVMLRRQADGSRLAGVSCRGYWEVSWIGGRRDEPLPGYRDTASRTFLMVFRGCLRSSLLLPIQPVMALGPPAWETGLPSDTSII